MAATPNQITEQAQATAVVAQQIKSVLVIARQVVAHGQTLGVDWNDLPAEAEDGEFVVGTEMTPGQVSNAIGSIDNFVSTFWAGQGVNLELLSKPIV